jgi:hypothetical protein
MADKETAAILGLKREVQTLRQRARDLKSQNDRWRSVARTLRTLAGLPDDQFKRLLTAESLPCD